MDREPSQSLPHAQNTVLPANAADNGDNLASLATAFEPYAVNHMGSTAMATGRPAAPLYGSQTGAIALSNDLLQSPDKADPGGSHGTLMLGRGGRAKYLGPTAGSEWLKDSETQDVQESPSATRAPSPSSPPAQPAWGSKSVASDIVPISFPFNAAPARVSTQELVSRLPPKEEAWTLVEAYFRYCAWQ
ncbi:hypothetical protein LTS15_005141 [Exophiala xenobiotica]|nr:hypothetical protein LTS15_005141 [Exophiala xenobiotica]